MASSSGVSTAPPPPASAPAPAAAPASTAIAPASALPHSSDRLTIASIDLGSALVSSFCVSPFIALIDRAIFENASGKRRMAESLRFGLTELFTAPWRAAARPEFRYIWGVYASTYIVANNVESYCKAAGMSPEWPKFVCVSATNVCASVLKDKAFTRMFGTTAPKSLPLLSYLLFFSRDSLTIAASFNAPNAIAARLERRGWNKNTARIVAQLTAPVAMQFVSAPLHLFALDLYNRPGAALRERAAFVAREYFKTALARASRIFPAFGICGVGNTFMKEALKDHYGVAH
jgi:hypothetical protein